MTAADSKKSEVGPPTTITATMKKKEEESKTTMNAVEAAGRRLERLFGGGRAAPAAAVSSPPTPASTSTSTSGAEGDKNATTTTAAVPPTTTAATTATVNNNNTMTTTTTTTTTNKTNINPSKILKKWLGSSSGTAASATLADVSHAAFVLLDPIGNCATGRDILVGLSTEEERKRVALAAVGNTTATRSKTFETKEGIMQVDAPVDDAADAAAIERASTTKDYLLLTPRQVESWLLTLAIRIAWRSSQFETAYQLSEKGIMILDAHLKECGEEGGDGGLHPLLARLLRYRSLTIESFDGVEKKTALMAEKRGELAMRHRMACLRRDGDVSATVLNLMLRDLLNADQVEQAQKLLSNSTFPTETSTNNQLLRYLYYSGRIQALRLEYTSSFSNLSQCLRKSPTHTALGFRIAVQRLLIVVQLLMGEIPDRSVFFAEGMRGELKPYLEIAQAVRRGDLAVFHTTVGRHVERLKVDGTFTLISRLAHSVVKAGLRRLKTSYSRISLEDIAVRLGLPSATSAEFVVAKAVRDGVIDATIDHEKGYVQSHDLVDVYATVEPSEAFHRRIAYCLTTHNDAVRGMRYPEDAYKKQLEASRGLRGRKGEDKTDEEKAQELEDEFDEDY